VHASGEWSAWSQDGLAKRAIVLRSARPTPAFPLAWSRDRPIIPDIDLFKDGGFVKRVLVTGANGMLGSEVMRLLGRNSAVTALGTAMKDMDVTNLRSVKETMERFRPSHVIHCAAYTFVDTAEKEPVKAYAINAEGTKNLAFFCREQDVELLYVSTDYVFDGSKRQPWVETDATGPLNVYGRSKLLGEVYTQTLLERHKIIRTSWLNGLGGDFSRNFIETMLRISESRSTLSLVNDQVGRPTFTFDLAQVLVTLLDVRAYGVFHVTNGGECSWYDFAREIFAQHGRTGLTLRPILSEQFRSAARRPSYSVMANTRLPGLGIAALPDWRESLREYFRRRSMVSSIKMPSELGPSPAALRA